MLSFKRGGGIDGALRILRLFLFALTPGFLLVAQEPPPPAEAAAEAGLEAVAPLPSEEAAAPPAEPELSEAEKAALKEKEERERFLELDIKTSTLDELAQWCRELGLSEGGAREDLAGRLRSYYKLAAPTKREKDQRIITIENARTTEYFTLETVDEEYARLSGGVEISLQDGEGLHKIRAWDILYNRTRNILSANGGVEYVHDERGTIETFKGDSIIINLDTWVGSFIDTIAERTIAGAETSYRFSGEVISRTDTDTMVLRKARVSNAKSDEPYWSLNASRIWLLPGSDWAIFNAVLKVGEVPVLYLPFFFYPSDDVVFHPALGTKTRQGYYVQTTTYFLGRSVPDPTKANSISKILGSGDGMEKVREGLFLRSTGKQETKKNDKRFSLMLDAYSQLGFYTGIDLALPSIGAMNHFTFSGGLGWTRTLFLTNGVYTPYQVDADIWDSDWNHSYLFGIEIPFRYRLNMATGVSGRFGSIDIKFPLYSDPFIDEDLYLYRSEQFDLMQFIRGGVAADDTTILTSSKLGSYQWSMSAKPNISTSVLAPYISSLSINSISTNLSFIPSRDMSTDAININNNVIKNSPSRQFFIPDKFTPYSISANISGTPVSTGTSPAQTAKEEPQNPLKDIGTPLPPWNKDDENENKPAAKSPYTDTLLPPALAQSWTLPMNNALRFSLTYNVNPSSAMEMQYNTRKFSSSPPAGTPPNLSAKDISWGDYDSTLMNFRSDGSLNLNLSEANNNLFASSLGFSGSYLWQDHNYINDSLEKKDKDNLLLSDYRGKQWTINSTYNFTFNPFYWSAPLNCPPTTAADR